MIRPALSLARVAGVAGLIALAIGATPSLADAHIMPAGQGSTRVVGNRAYTLVAIPVSVLEGFDDDRDGLLSVDELKRHGSALEEQVKRRLRIIGNGNPGRIIYQTLVVEHNDGPASAGMTAVTLVRITEWDGPVKTLSVHADLFSAGAKNQLSFRALSADRTEVAILTSTRTGHEFFRGSWATFKSFVVVGAEHILLGVDHLFFLLAVLIVGSGWRYWLAVVTSFTVAHSITLVAASLGLVRVPPAIVEPLIAASIVLLAIDQLRRGSGPARQRVALVFGCGLLHGLGFAGALADMGVGGTSRWASLVGFNFGVEAGQALFVVAMIGAIAVTKRVWSDAPARLPRFTAYAAATFGLVLLAQRVAGLRALL
jgi:hydrogenase/urease accessory protein HupE